MIKNRLRTICWYQNLFDKCAFDYSAIFTNNVPQQFSRRECDIQTKRFVGLHNSVPLIRIFTVRHMPSEPFLTSITCPIGQLERLVRYSGNINQSPICTSVDLLVDIRANFFRFMVRPIHSSKAEKKRPSFCIIGRWLITNSTERAFFGNIFKHSFTNLIIRSAAPFIQGANGVDVFQLTHLQFELHSKPLLMTFHIHDEAIFYVPISTFR
ncbi:hypothetical protein DERF_001677 [Dermatophagoides farinae]|uniref:Uncharacterized protein n=1 Tax=Dermatophagoides farinae TaxID=6954 RepID=A0A922ICQ6_DERFA|nr:hypothetical protein DERF_001677 [Dermatophagoides farinae]